MGEVLLSRHQVVHRQLPFFQLHGLHLQTLQLGGRRHMRATTAVRREIAKAHLPKLLRIDAHLARQLKGDLFVAQALNCIRLQRLGLLCRFEDHTGIVRPMLCFDRPPMLQLHHMANQMACRMQACMQLALLGIDLREYRPQCQRLGQIVDDLLAHQLNTQYLKASQQSLISRLAAALRVKWRGIEDDAKAAIGKRLALHYLHIRL